jgi:hypothetical protein
MVNVSIDCDLDPPTRVARRPERPRHERPADGWCGRGVHGEPTITAASLYLDACHFSAAPIDSILEGQQMPASRG